MIKEYLEKITDIDEKFLRESFYYEMSLVKPPRSLGVLENIAIKMSSIKKSVKTNVKNKRILVFAGDNGVVEENISCSPKSITYEQCINLTNGITGCSSMAKHNGFDLIVYDIGVDFDFNEYYQKNNFNENSDTYKNLPFSKKRVIDKKIAYGTKNLLKENAMTYEECEKAILLGIDAVKEAKEQGIDIIGIGEMGIGNTTTSSALLSFISELDVLDLTGRGGGLLDDALAHKIKVIEMAIERTKKNIDKKENYSYDELINIMASLGGYDICAMCGAYIGVAYYKMPVVIDGFISVVAALYATLFNSKCAQYMFTSHKSVEIGYNEAINIINKKLFNNNVEITDYTEFLKLCPLFDLEMRLGEGSGAVIAFQIIDTALAMHSLMSTFLEAKINDDYLAEIRKQ